MKTATQDLTFIFALCNENLGKTQSFYKCREPSCDLLLSASFALNLIENRLKMTDIVDITTADSQSPNATFLFTSESVGEGHPGEIC